jgi:hypothetical protein
MCCMTEMSLPFADQLPQIEIKSGQGGYQRHGGDNATLCKLWLAGCGLQKLGLRKSLQGFWRSFLNSAFRSYLR